MSRSTRFCFHLSLAAAALTAAVTAITSGCTASALSDFASPNTPLSDDGSHPGMGMSPDEDAGPPNLAAYRGNPLCRVAGSQSCMPDDDGYNTTQGTTPCWVPPDAGEAGAPELQLKGCRVEREGAVISTGCEKATAEGTDGMACEVGAAGELAGAQCAPGFDCVAGENGTKTCRRYCCGGTCKNTMSQSGGATFCDVQSLVDVNQKAPVCMPLKHCKLLGAGECSEKETCAVVTELGDTGCVGVGDQQAGASCDADHCAADLTCLGQPGARKCFKLCKVASNDCGSAQICETTTVFKDPSFGICQKP